MIRKLVGNGGSLENRMRFPVEVAAAVRAALPGDTPLFARISAVDWIDGGWEMDDSVALAKALKGAGVDVVDCSSGGNLLKGATNSNLARSPGYRAPFARRLREEAAVMTQAVGLIRTPGLAEQLLREGMPISSPSGARCSTIASGHITPPRQWANGLRSMGDEPEIR
jgi:2,4-dienoyl-CoA reductase-like NADH-dependent reductase (Old Yellow Enzyme family)